MNKFFSTLLKIGIAFFCTAFFIAFVLGVIYVAENGLQLLIAIPLFIGSTFILISTFYYIYREN